MERAGVSILLRVVAAGLVLLVALALNAAPASACSQRQASLATQPNPQTTAIRNSAQAIVAFEAADAWGTANSATGDASGDQCGSRHCCGHCPTCSGGVLAPASTDLLAPSLSRDWVMACSTVLTGVSQSPDERPPRSI